MPKTKQIIKDVLEDVAERQLNLASETARNTLATLITVALKEWGQPDDLPDIHVEHEMVDVVDFTGKD